MGSEMCIRDSLCVVNLFNEARNTVSNSGKGSISFRSIDYRFSRVYLLRFSKGQLGPRDIDLNNNNIGRRDSALMPHLITPITG